MFRSTGFRLIAVGILTLFMFIPMFFVGAIIDDRSHHARTAVTSISREWGGAQTLIGPYIVIPVSGPVERIVNREITDPLTGEVTINPVAITEEGRKDAIYILPDQFDVTLTTAADVRQRGIFRVPVYRADSAIQMTYDFAAAEGLLDTGETAHWDEAILRLGLSDNRALRGDAALTLDGADMPLSPRIDQPGIQATLGDPRDVDSFTLALTFNGASSLFLAPVGRASSITLQSDWPHPSFAGAFLPDASTIEEAGFDASWTIPHLARTLPQVARHSPESRAQDLAFGVRYYQPNDFYQKAYRAARHSILFIALTFLTVFLIENRSERPVHPVQYLMIGLAQAIFVLLMTSYAEQIGFDAAFLLSAGATIAMLTAYGATGLGLGRRAWVLASMLIGIYAVLYLILQSTDYALLTGSTLAFCALAGTLYATRNERWYGPRKEPAQWLHSVRRALTTPAPTPPTAPSEPA